MAKLRLQDIIASTPPSTARIALQGLLVTGAIPDYSRLRLAGLAVSGEPAILTDVYAYTGTDWKPAPPLTWDGGEWR